MVTGARENLCFLIKTGNIEGNLLKSINSFGYEFHKLPSFIKNNEWYGFYVPENRQFFTITQIYNPFSDFNSYAAIVSYSNEKNKRLLEEFIKKTGIQMKGEAPSSLEKSAIVSLSLMFPIIESHGPDVFKMMEMQLPGLY